MSRVFISYSRSELTFADSLYHELQQAGQDVWMDIYGLQVGKPWQQQIDGAIAACEIMLLVVSPRAIASQNVCREWDLALKQGKRVILLLFRPARINSAACLKRGGGDICQEAAWDTLRGCEWVDFRSAFPKALAHLNWLLREKAPRPPQHPIPTHGLKIPPTPRWFVLLGLIPFLSSMLAVNPFTLFQLIAEPSSIVLATLIPVTLLTSVIPLMVYTRRFGVLETTLIILVSIPGYLGLILLGFFRPLGGDPAYGTALGALGMILMALIQLQLLGSRGMYRWAKGRGVVIEASPQRLLPWRRLVVVVAVLFGAYAYFFPEAPLIVACMVVGMGAGLLYGIPWLVSRSSAYYQRRRGRVYRTQPERSVTFALESAPQDQDLATAINKTLQKHHRAVPLTEAEVVVPLLSRFQLTTAANLERQAVLPIRLGDVFSAKDPAQRLDPRLGELQTIDLRRGVTDAKLTSIANNLDEPGRILIEMGEFPRHLQTVRPLAVDWLILALQVLVMVVLIRSAWWMWDYGRRLYPLPDALAELDPTSIDSTSGSYSNDPPIIYDDLRPYRSNFTPEDFGTTYVVKGFDRVNPPPDVEEQSYRTFYAAEDAEAGWCVLLGRPEHEPLELWATDDWLMGGVYYTSAEGWHMMYFYDDHRGGTTFDKLHDHLGCDLHLVTTDSAMQHTARVALSGLLVIGAGFFAIRRLQTRQRRAYQALGLVIIGCALAPQVPLLTGAVAAALLAFAMLNRNVRHYIP